MRVKHFRLLRLNQRLAEQIERALWRTPLAPLELLRLRALKMAVRRRLRKLMRAPAMA